MTLFPRTTGRVHPYRTLLESGYTPLPLLKHTTAWARVIAPFCTRPAPPYHEAVMQPWWALNIAEALFSHSDFNTSRAAQRTVEVVLAWCAEKHPERAQAALMVYQSAGDPGLQTSMYSGTVRNGDPLGTRALQDWLVAQRAVDWSDFELERE